MARIELRDSRRWTLVTVEIIMISLVLSYWLATKFSWDFITGVVTGIISMLILSGLFFLVRVFRYIFSIVFSLFWGLLAYMFADSASASSVTPWATFALVLFISLALHKDYFRFESGKG